MLKIENLAVSAGGKRILDGVCLEIPLDKVTALMGSNGSGKSTLAQVIMGDPGYTIESGRILLNDEDITALDVSERAKKGLFLSFQYPVEVPGVSLSNFLRVAYTSVKGKIGVFEFAKILKEKLALLHMDESFSTRSLNEGFSGGEKKRAEILQMAVLQPKLAILDETDSGTDVDALKIIADSINLLRKQTGIGIVLITHYDKMLELVRPDIVHVMDDGKIVKSGGMEVAQEVVSQGYTALKVKV